MTYFAFFPPPCHAGVTESRSAIRSACTWRRRLRHRLFKPAIMTSHAVTVPGLVAQGAITQTHHWDTYDNNTCLSPVSELLSNQMKKADFGTSFLCSTTKCERKLAAIEKTDLRDVTKGTGVSSQRSGNAPRLVDLQPTGPSGVEGPTKDRFQKKVNAGCQQRAKQVTSWSFIVTFDNLWCEAVPSEPRLNNKELKKIQLLVIIRLERRKEERSI